MRDENGKLAHWAGAWAMVLALTAAAGAHAAPIQFNRDIRPILSDNCFHCHGPDSASRKAKLRLDQRESAVAKEAIVPGKPEASSLVERIFNDDAEVIMPPPAAHKKLTGEQKELLKRWIAEGAEYQPLWSFLPVPREIPVPQVEGGPAWIRNPIDAFVLRELRGRKWEPAPEATKEKWLRRVSFDLTGLPPTLAEIDAFLADTSPGAYETVVDRLLKSPSFGERMANDWLDAARYADTFGYQSDRDMHVWPWRDWLIRAFNENLSYDKFILWQTAGDMLENPTRDQLLATAFNRLHRQTNEGGSIEEEFRVSYVADRVQTNGIVFLGLSLECAKCHDHKYDPILQKDFYALSAFYNNIDEHGLYSHFTETAPTPALLLYEGDQEARHRDLLSRIKAKEAELAAVRGAAQARFAALPPVAEIAQPAADKAFTFDDIKPNGENKLVEGKNGKALEFSGDDAFGCGKVGEYSRTSAFSFGMWLKPGANGARELVLHRSQAAEDAAFRGYSLVVNDGHVRFSLVHFWPGNAIAVETKQVIPVKEWSHVVVAYDGSSHAAGLQIYINGVPAELNVVRDRLTRDITYRPQWGDSGGGDLALGARFRDVGFKDGAIDDLAVFNRQLTPCEAPLVGGFKITPTSDARFEHYLLRVDAPFQAALKDLAELRRQENELVSQVKQVMVMSERPDRRPTFVLKRGAYDSPGDAVEPATPAGIFPLPAEYPRNRLGLGQWMIDARNPLPSRVAVNRFWNMFFGRGIVASVEDFGSQGQPPTHPELLDWLARHFMESGWNVKELCKFVVLSATYRQSSTPRNPALYTDDPDNRWLARGSRYRLSAEQIRDNALAVSGLLNARVGGQSVMPYQPAGLWEEAGTGKSYNQSHGADLYRRSLYTFWRRTSPPPSMLSFDATTREVCTARRERTNTPLQALVLLNDPQYVEAARVLAEKLITAHGAAIDVRVRTAFRLLTSREPSARELEVLTHLYRDQNAHFQAAKEEAKAFVSIGEAKRNEKLDVADLAATAVVVKMLMSFDECVTKR